MVDWDIVVLYVSAMVGVFGAIVISITELYNKYLAEKEKRLTETLLTAKTPTELSKARRDYDRFNAMVHPDEAVRRPY